jgi:para-aminobenzoate synthetase/4-amino-4-deoxychorismate lyase
MRRSPDPRAGVFETLLVAEGRPLELDAHLARLERSLHELFAALPPTGLRDQVLTFAAGVRLGRLRVTVAPSAVGPLEVSAVVKTLDRDIVFPRAEQAVDLRPLELAGGLGAHKWADRRLLDEAAADPAIPLVVDMDGTVLEASRGNVFLVLDGTLVTPRADGRLLPGVARRRVLELARGARIAVRETVVTAADLRRATEVFLTNSVRGIEPVRSLGGTVHWLGWPAATLLARRLEALWALAPLEEASPWS